MSKRLTHRAVAATLIVLLAVTTAASCSSDTDDAEPTTTLWQGSIRPTTSITTPSYAPQGTETEADYANAFIAGYQAQPFPMFPGIDIACVAPKWVSVLTVDTFFATGITPASLASNAAGLDDLVGDEDTAGKILDAVAECGLPLVDLYIQGLGVAVSSDPAKDACVRAAVTADDVRGALAASMAKGETVVPQDLAASCLA